MPGPHTTALCSRYGMDLEASITAFGYPALGNGTLLEGGVVGMVVAPLGEG